MRFHIGFNVGFNIRFNNGFNIGLNIGFNIGVQYDNRGPLGSGCKNGEKNDKYQKGWEGWVKLINYDSLKELQICKKGF